MKKTIVLFLVLSLILGLCACGKTPADKTPPTVASTEAPTEAATESSTEASTEMPTEAPTTTPTKTLCSLPTKAPTKAPTTAPTTVATKAPTTVATQAPATAPTTPVTTVIDYTHPINIEGSTVTHHFVKCPALTANTPDAQAINKEVHDMYATAVQNLKTSETVEWLYFFNYTYTDYDGIIALVLDLTVSAPKGEAWPVYNIYYYDTNTGKQLTFEQYLSALGTHEAAVFNAFVSEHGESLSPDCKIEGAAIDKTTTHILLHVQHPEMGDMFTMPTLKTSTLKAFSSK